MLEAEIRKATKLRVMGWLKSRGLGKVLLDFSDKRRMPSGLKNAPDWILLLPDTTILVEFKSLTGTQTDGQLEFWLALFPFLGHHLRYILAMSPDRVMDELMQWEIEREKINAL